MEIVIITGLSGAGKSQAMKALEDLGFYCVDNLPPVLIPNFVELCTKNMETLTRIALVVDIRGGRFFNDLDSSLDILQDLGHYCDIVFLEASDEVLIKRFKETRRTHPLKPYGSIEEGIALEKQLLTDLRRRAHLLIDTSHLNNSQLKAKLYQKYAGSEKESPLSLSIVSFGYKYGIPMDADFVFDLRMLPNPFYVEAFKALTGEDQAVRDYVMSFPESERYLTRIIQNIDFVLPLCVTEGRSQLVLALGCTGGQHRSVTFAYHLAAHFQKTQYRVFLRHRELERKAQA